MGNEPIGCLVSKVWGQDVILSFIIVRNICRTKHNLIPPTQPQFCLNQRVRVEMRVKVTILN